MLVWVHIKYEFDISMSITAISRPRSRQYRTNLHGQYQRARPGRLTTTDAISTRSGYGQVCVANFKDSSTENT